MAHQHVATKPSTPAVAVVGEGAQVPYATLIIWQILTQFMRAQVEPEALAGLAFAPVTFPAMLPDGTPYEGKVELTDGRIQVFTRPDEVNGNGFDNRTLWQAHLARQWLARLGPWDGMTLNR